MPPKIHILSSEVADQIAAGEVVERPASVVKELAENSLDAGATRVEVETIEAGRKLILVADDGHGMGREDLMLAVKRHATSKIASADELWDLGSFGFRGEALPSIASVSRLSVTSRLAGSDEAWCLKVDAAKAGEPEPASLAHGTRIEARELFFNTPARLKFLKQPATENQRIQDALVGLALASPQTGFRLKQDGRVALDWPKAHDLGHRAAQVMGQSFVDEGLLLDRTTPEVEVTGWVGRPHAHRGNRSGQHLFVNGRAVDHRLFNFTLSQAFGALIPAGRFAQALVFLKLPRGRLDVNVHPAKREVRFVRESDVLSTLRHAIQDALGKAKLSVPLDLHAPAAFPYQPQAPGQPMSSWAIVADAQAGSAGQLLGTDAQYVHPAPAPHQSGSGWMPEPTSPADPSLPVALAQLHRSYIVCQSPEGLILVDQHAGHERVLYERILKQLDKGALEHQALLLPQKLEFGVAQAQRLKGWMPALAQLGLELSDLGNGDYYLQSVPSLLKGQPAAPLIQDLLAGADDEAEADPAAWLKREAAASMACHSAVKAGDPLTLEEMRGLVAELFQCQLPWACPHGRPPFVSVSLFELEKYFKRR